MPCKAARAQCFSELRNSDESQGLAKTSRAFRCGESDPPPSSGIRAVELAVLPKPPKPKPRERLRAGPPLKNSSPRSRDLCKARPPKARDPKQRPLRPSLSRHLCEKSRLFVLCRVPQLMPSDHCRDRDQIKTQCPAFSAVICLQGAPGVSTWQLQLQRRTRK